MSTSQPWKAAPRSSALSQVPATSAPTSALADARRHKFGLINSSGSFFSQGFFLPLLKQQRKPEQLGRTKGF